MRIWQSTAKRGEYSETTGKWFAQRSSGGHLVGPVLGPYETECEARRAATTQGR